MKGFHFSNGDSWQDKSCSLLLTIAAADQAASNQLAAGSKQHSVGLHHPVLADDPQVREYFTVLQAIKEGEKRGCVLRKRCNWSQPSTSSLCHSLEHVTNKLNPERYDYGTGGYCE